MGNGIAHVFAQHGFNVSIVDLNANQLELAVQKISKNLDRQISKGTISEKDKASTLANIKTFSTLGIGVDKADLVVEAATENVPLKMEIFRQLDTLTPAIHHTGNEHLFHIDYENSCGYHAGHNW